MTVGNLLQRQCSEVTSEALQRRGAALMCTHLCTHTRAHTHLHAHSPLDQEAGGLPELNVAMMTFADVMLIEIVTTGGSHHVEEQGGSALFGVGEGS